MTTQPIPISKGDSRHPDERATWHHSILFIGVQATPFVALGMGADPSALWTAFGFYMVGMFFITAGYHRYFSHRTYKTGRFFQFLLAVGAQCTAQKGVLWWAAHHRHHHKYSDQPEDVHSPRRGFWWSHIKWILVKRYERTEIERVPDLAKYPELRWLNTWFFLCPLALGTVIFLVGGWSHLLVGYFGGLFLTWQCTFLVNSLAHVIGKPRYETGEDSKNSLLIALLTHGEGWHNNHHHYQSSTRQGFYWWEVDLTWYVLKALSVVGVVWGLREPPKRILEGSREDPGPVRKDRAA